jgi:hypothetical protein
MIKLTDAQKKIAEELDGKMRVQGLEPRRSGFGARYDRDGDPITFGEFAALVEDQSYRVVEQTTIETQFGKFWVSTVWLGMDHRFTAGGRPVIFETMIVRERDQEWLGPVRYSTEADAKVGHEVAKAIAAGGALNFVDNLGELVHDALHEDQKN